VSPAWSSFAFGHLCSLGRPILMFWDRIHQIFVRIFRKTIMLHMSDLVSFGFLHFLGAGYTSDFVSNFMSDLL
jgi:hypothetical protein